MNNYLYIKISDKNINKTILKIRNNNINILKIKYLSNNEVLLLINKNDYKKINKIRNIKQKIVSEKGLNKYKTIINYYKIPIFIFLISVLMLYILTNIIFEIDIELDNKSLKNKLYKELKNYNIKKYSYRKNYNDIQKIKKDILYNHKDDIEWLEIKQSGYKYIINVVERKKNKNIISNDSTNIIASRSGIIKRIINESGETIIDENNYVNKGDIIISGSIKLNDKIKSTIKSKGKVYAETWYNVKISYPLYYKEKVYLKDYKYTPFIKINNKYYNLFNYKNNINIPIISYKNKLIPFEIGICKLRKIKIINKKYSIYQAKKKAIKISKEKVLQRLDKDSFIINEKTLKFYSNSSKIDMEVFFSVYENIAKEETNIDEIDKEG